MVLRARRSWIRAGRIVGVLLAAYGVVWTTALILATVRFPEFVDLVPITIGAALGTFLGIYLLVRVRDDAPALILTLTVLALVQLTLTMSWYPGTILELAGWARPAADIVDRLGEWAAPVMGVVLLTAPEWIGEAGLVGIVLFATRFPRPLTETDLWIRQRTRDSVGPIRTALTRVRVSLLNPWVLVAVVGGAILLLSRLPWWVENLGDVLIGLLAASYLLDGFAVGDAEDRSRLGWVGAAFGAAMVMLSTWAIFAAAPEALELLGVTFRPSRTVDTLFDWLLYLGPAVAMLLLAVAILGRGAVDPDIALRGTIVLSVLGVMLTLSFAVAEELVTEWAVARAGVPDLLGPMVAAGLVLALLPPLRWGLDRTLGMAVEARVGQALRETERRTSLLVSAEFAGYQALVADHPDEGVRMIRLLRLEAGRLQGRLARATGDGVLLEFTDAGQAVADAVRLRQAMDDHQATAPKPVELRTAVHQGDVVAGPDGDLLGPGAGNVELLRRRAEPGQIVVSEAVTDDATLADRADWAEAVEVEAPGGPLRGRVLASYRTADGSRRRSSWTPATAAAVATVAVLGTVLGAGEPATGPEATLEIAEQDSLFETGASLDARTVHRLEARVLRGEGDLTTHGLLLRYHRERRVNGDRALLNVEEWRMLEHALWIIRHRPDAPVIMFARPLTYSVGLRRPMEAAWRDQVRQYPDDPDVQYHASEFLRGDSLRLEILTAARERFPGDPRFPFSLGIELYLDGVRAQDSERDSLYRQTLARMDTTIALAPVSERASFARAWAIRLLVKLDRTEEVEPYALRLLELPDDSAHAYIRHLGHTALGLARLEGGDRAAALRHLTASVESLAVVRGLEMALAEALLEAGARRPVLDFLETAVERTSSEWFRENYLEPWIETLREGGTPDFGRWGSL